MPSTPGRHGRSRPRADGPPRPQLILLAVLFHAQLTGCAAPSSSAHVEPPVLTVGFALPAAGPFFGMRPLAAILGNEGLVRFARDGRMRPELGQAWETSTDGLDLRVRLTRGVRFPDGVELTAGIVKASLDASRSDERLRFQYPMLRDIAGIRVDDPSTLTLELHRPSALLIEDLSVPITRSDGGAELATGAFHVTSATDDLMVLKAHPGYWRGSPALAAVQIRSYPTVRTAWAAMMRGELELLLDVPSESREFVEKEPTIKVHPFIRTHVYSLVFNLRVDALAPRAVRVALNLAADRQAIIDRALGGRGLPARTHLWPLHWTYRADLPGFDYNPTRALELLATPGRPVGAGVEFGRLRFTSLVPAGVSPHEEIAAVLQQQFLDIGVEMQIEPVPVNEFVQRMGAGQFEAAILDLSGGPGLARMYTFWHSSSSGAFYGQFGYRGADEVLERLREARGDAALEAAVRDVTRALYEDPPAVFLCWPELARAISRRFTVPESDFDILWSIWSWKLASAAAADTP